VTTTSSSTVDIVSTANDLGVILDGQLTMATQFSPVCCAAFFPATSAAIHLPISDDRGDTCFSPGLHQLSTRLLQLPSGRCRRCLSSANPVCAENAAARLVSGAHRQNHIMPVLVSLHWLPVHQRVIYKMTVIVWKCLHDATLVIWLTCVCRPIPCMVTSNCNGIWDSTGPAHPDLHQSAQLHRQWTTNMEQSAS